MTDNDLDRIERELGIRLPVDYREIMRAYPFGPGTHAAEFGLPDDADGLITANRGPGPHGFAGYFRIGSDGGEEEYYIDLHRIRSPVYRYALETSERTIVSDDLNQYVQRCMAIEAEIEEDERELRRRREGRTWWQFWR